MIYLLRHGLDDETKIGGYSNVSLTDEGIIKTKEARSFIEKNINFNKIISSDVKRAVQTSNIVNENLNKEIIYADLLREQDKGDYNGILKASLDKDDYFLGKINTYDTYPNGESLMDLYFRVEKLLLEIDRWDDNLLVTHRGVINMIYYILNDIKPTMYKDEFKVTHSSVHKLDLSKNKIERIY